MTLFCIIAELHNISREINVLTVMTADGFRLESLTIIFNEKITEAV